MTEEFKLQDFDKEVAQNIWEESLLLADDLVPLLFQASKKHGFETLSHMNDPAKIVIRRTLAVFLVGCFMNSSVLDTDNLDGALNACKHVAKDLLKPKSKIITQ